MRDIAGLLGITERRTQRIVADLARGRLHRARARGAAQPLHASSTHLPLGLPTQRDIDIGALLAILPTPERLSVSGRRLAGSWLIGVGRRRRWHWRRVRGELRQPGLPAPARRRRVPAAHALGADARALSRARTWSAASTGCSRSCFRYARRRRPRPSVAPSRSRHAWRGLRRGARRWAKELQLITTDGYETASRISALRELTGEQDDRALVAEAVRVLGAERARAGADPTLTNDPVSILAYGLGARPAEADLTSLDDLLSDLGLAGEGDELTNPLRRRSSPRESAPSPT